MPNNQIITAYRIELRVQEMTMNEQLTLIGLNIFLPTRLTTCMAKDIFIWTTWRWRMATTHTRAFGCIWWTSIARAFWCIWRTSISSLSYWWSTTSWWKLWIGLTATSWWVLWTWRAWRIALLQQARIRIFNFTSVDGRWWSFTFIKHLSAWFESWCFWLTYFKIGSTRHGCLWYCVHCAWGISIRRWLEFGCSRHCLISLRWWLAEYCLNLIWNLMRNL